MSIIKNYRIIVYLENIIYPNNIEDLKSNLHKILSILFVVYSLIIFFLYQHYATKIESEKAEILKEYCNKIAKISTEKIQSLIQRLSISTQAQNILIKTHINDLELCNNNKCLTYNLFRFGARINQYIPEFIHYKIELNKSFVYTNFKLENYQMVKTYHINKDNQFNISLSVDSFYWGNVEAQIRKPIWIVISFIMANSLIFYLLYKTLLNSSKRLHSAHYQNQYQEKLQCLESSFMNKIWNLNFNKQKDIEINCLFAQEANKLALINEGFDDEKGMIKDCKLKELGSNVPCSIVLYQQDKIEEISIEQLIHLFTERFDQEDDNISVKLISKEKVVHFSSKAALYQIIYSIVSYLIFVIKHQNFSGKSNINIYINSTEEKKACLCFEYSCFPITEEKELFKMVKSFFKNHANPFLLNINQVFSILKANGFDCRIKYDQYNIIEIVQQKQKNVQYRTTRDNIIFLSSIFERKK